MSTINDPEVKFLASLAHTLEADYVSKEQKLWAGSPFHWIKTRPSRQVGTIGEALVSGWSAAKGFDVQKPLSSEHDRIIEGIKVEIKFSTLWSNNTSFKFQQIRDQDYEYAFLLGIAPFDAKAWFVPKKELTQDRPPHLRPQHGGASGRDTRWLSIPYEQAPSWLSVFGGTLSSVKELITKAAHKA